MAQVIQAVVGGLPVRYVDADSDLAHYPDIGFDYVVLSRTLQAVGQPSAVLCEMLRIGARTVVSFPHFGHWQSHLQLLTSGRMPMTGILDRIRYQTPTSIPARSVTCSIYAAQRGMKTASRGREMTPCEHAGCSPAHLCADG
jgi:methionine biosynthesis protein MetW